MTDVQLTRIQRLSGFTTFLLHIAGIVVGAFIFLFLAVIVAIIFQIETPKNVASLGLAFMLVGAVLPSVLLWRARRSTYSPPATITQPTTRETQAVTATPPPIAQAEEYYPAIDAQEHYEDDFEEEERAVERPAGKVRSVDWLQLCKLPVAFSVIGFLLIFGLIDDISKGSKTLTGLVPKTQEDTLLVVVAAAYIVLWPLAIVSQILGIVFDAKRDRLSYPRYIIRRAIRLSEIHDANSQTVTKPAFQITNTIIGLVSVGQIKGLGTTKRYFANLSGDFGSRRVVFHTKSKRDAFFSLLRRFAPDCRITRWY